MVFPYERVCWEIESGGGEGESERREQNTGKNEHVRVEEGAVIMKCVDDGACAAWLVLFVGQYEAKHAAFSVCIPFSR